MADPGYEEFIARLTRLIGHFLDASEAELVRSSEASSFGHLVIEVDAVIDAGNISRATGTAHFRRTVRLKEVP